MRAGKRVTNVLVFVLLIVAGCSSTKEAAKKEMSPVAGLWSYVVETPGGPYSGQLTIVESPEDGSLSGVISSNELDQEVPVRDIVWESGQLTFSGAFSMQQGLMAFTFRATITDGVSTGVMSTDSFGDLPVTARKTPTEE